MVGATVGAIAVLWVATSLGGPTGFAFGLAALSTMTAALLGRRLRAVERELRARPFPAPPDTIVAAAPASAGGDASSTGPVATETAATDGPNQTADAVVADSEPVGTIADVRFGIAPDELTTDRESAPRMDSPPDGVDTTVPALPAATDGSVTPAEGSDGGTPPTVAASGAPTEPGPAPFIPDAMPDITLVALSGDPVRTSELGSDDGRPTVVVFWRPGCAHSVRLTPELVAWESLQGPRLVVIAACDGPAAYRAGLPGLVLLDPGFTVGRALGARGTPSALTIGSDGHPGSPVVGGAGAVNTHLLDAMRTWSESESDAGSDPAQESGSGTGVDGAADREPGDEQNAAFGPMVPPAVLLRRLDIPLAATPSSAGTAGNDAPVRRVG